eukprot:scaffold109323_cov31-Tisochrysis_lutea.AAC.2
MSWRGWRGRSLDCLASLGLRVAVGVISLCVDRDGPPGCGPRRLGGVAPAGVGGASAIRHA